MRKPAKVKFIGIPSQYKVGCKVSPYMYCRDCKLTNCTDKTFNNFENGKIYNAYFLEYWQGNRDSLHVKGENGEIEDFIPLSDFEVLEDIDDVLNTKEASVRCITHKYDNKLFDLTYGKEYKAIGFDLYGRYLVMDDSWDCYFYLPKEFEIISDPHQILNPNISKPIYDFDDFED